MGKFKPIVLVVLLILVFAAIVAGTLKFSLGRFVIPAYPKEAGTLSEALAFYQEELAKQGKRVEIEILDDAADDVLTDLRGLDGNAYVYLLTLERKFGVRVKFGLWRTITISGSDSKGEALTNASSKRAE